MTAKEYLSQLKDYEDTIRTGRDTVARMEADLYSLSGIDYSQDKVQTSPDTDAVKAAKLDALAKERDRIDRLTIEKMELRIVILGQLEGMETYVYRSLLYRRYVEYKRLDVIAEEMSYEYGYIRQLHGAALQEFERLYLSDE